jgi:hypothetical protein
MVAALNSNEIRTRLDACPSGAPGWREFEDAAVDALTYLFVPPLQPPRIQPRTMSGVERRDAVFANRMRDPSTCWGLIHSEFDARMIAVEFKNYDAEDIGPEEVAQIASYLRASWGRFAILCVNKVPNESARRRRNTLYSNDHVVILFITADDLREMLDMKDRGDEPGDFILDAVESFYLQHD